MKAAAVLIATTLNLVAADLWIGTWQKVSTTIRLDPAPQAVVTERPNGFSFTLKNGDTTSSWSAELDGRDYPAAGIPNTSHVALRRVDGNSIEVTGKRDGKAVRVSLYSVSADGKQMSAIHTYPGFLNYRNEYLFERTAGAANDKNLFVGVWTMNQEKTQSAADQVVRIESDGPDGIRFSNTTSGSVWTGQFDGKEHPLTSAYRGWTSVTLRRTGERTFEVTGKRAKTGPENWRFVVSSDSNEMTLDGDGSWSTGALINLREAFRRR